MGEKKWHYFSGNKQVGPVSAETIQEMLDAGALDLNTQVWTQGFESWKSITTVDQFHVHHPPNVPPLPQTVKATKEGIRTPEISGPQIRPWVRYWARMMDFLLFSLFSGFVLGVVYPPALEINDIFLGVILLFVYVFVEPIMLTSWGTTPGKALLRVTLRKSTGGKPTYLEALSRSFSVWIGGCGLGIPLVSLITLISAYNKLTKKSITTWDEGGNFTVTHGTIGTIRVVVIILFFIGSLLLIALGESEF
jgi:hypothetical protein